MQPVSNILLNFLFSFTLTLFQICSTSIFLPLFFFRQPLMGFRQPVNDFNMLRASFLTFAALDAIIRTVSLNHS
jgi:hypothetical protein